MHLIEGIVAIFVGAVPWLIATGAFPGNAEQRARLERAMPFVRNRLLMQGAAIFLWLFGGAIVANNLFSLGIPI